MAVSRLWEMSGKPVVQDSLRFADVAADSTDAEAIRWAAAEGITSGYTDTWFGGADPVTREQLATMIYHFVQRYDMGFHGAWMFHLACKDLDKVQKWACEPMFWMVASKLYDGSADTLLRPQDAVTAEEAETVFAGLAAAAAKKGMDFTSIPADKEA